MNQFEEANQLETITRGSLVVISATVLSAVIGIVAGLSFVGYPLEWILAVSLIFGASIGTLAATRGGVRRLAWKIFDKTYLYLTI